MGDGVFNIAKGRVIGYHDRVKANIVAASEYSIMLGIGAISDATLIDLDDFAAIIADGGFTESVATNYVRKVFTDSTLDALPGPTDGSDFNHADMADIVWTALGNGANSTLTRLILGYDPLGTDVDANIIALCFFDFSVQTDGTDVTAQVNASGYFRAT